MGRIQNIREKAARPSPSTRGDAGRLWREIFVNKERDFGPNPSRPDHPTTPGGNNDPRAQGAVQDVPVTRRSISAANETAYVALLKAMRSRAPGGWASDHWEQLKHYVGIAYVGIDRIGRQWQRFEFNVYMKDETSQNGKRAVTENDPPQGGRFCKPYDLIKLLQRPNKQDHWGKLCFRWCQQKKLTGMALTWVVPNGLGVPIELYCIPTALAIPQAVINEEYPDGYYRIQPVYPYGPFSSYPTPAAAVGAAIPAEWMMRFMDPHPFFRYEGYGPLEGGRQQLDSVEMIDKSRNYKMRTSFNPSAVLQMDGADESQGLPEDEIERIRAEFENQWLDPSHHGNLFVTYPGARVEEWGKGPAEYDYPQSWEQLISFCLGGVFGITKQAAGMIEDSSYATLFATLKQLHVTELEPSCEDLGAELTAQLAPHFGDNLIVEVRCPRIDDHELRLAKLDQLIAAKCVTKNQVLIEWGMPPTDEPWGEDIAGDPSPNESAQMQQEMEMSMMAPPGMEGEEGSPEEAQAGIGSERPGPGELGRGSLGPRKHVMSPKIKRFQPHRNGKGGVPSRVS
jgi:hypothetical protein